MVWQLPPSIPPLMLPGSRTPWVTGVCQYPRFGRTLLQTADDLDDIERALPARFLLLASVGLLALRVMRLGHLCWVLAVDGILNKRAEHFIPALILFAKVHFLFWTKVLPVACIVRPVVHRWSFFSELS